jgi:hypothetical protein
LAMAQTVAGAAVTALAGRWMVGAENRFHVSDVTYHDDEAAVVMLVLPQIVRRILENHIDAAMLNHGRKIFTIVLYFSDCSSSHPCQWPTQSLTDVMAFSQWPLSGS